MLERTEKARDAAWTAFQEAAGIQSGPGETRERARRGFDVAWTKARESMREDAAEAVRDLAGEHRSRPIVASLQSAAATLLELPV